MTVVARARSSGESNPNKKIITSEATVITVSEMIRSNVFALHRLGEVVQ